VISQTFRHPARLAEHGSASVLQKTRKPGDGCPGSRASFFKTSMKYVEKHFTLRIHRRDGTSKLLLGVTGSPPKVGSVKTIRLAEDEVLKVKMVDHPRRGEPAEAIEV
jgi:hypothetical protein